MSNRNLAEYLLPIATINRTSAELIVSSAHAWAGTARYHETRLDSIYGVFPKMVLGERNRHRCFSLSDRSSRAVPPEKLRMKRFYERRGNIGRPLDIGGPRDEWIDRDIDDQLEGSQWLS
jgi:hypothetical protein